jgi:hypothetical protein
MDLFGRIEQDLAARRDSGALARAIVRWQLRHHGLRPFDDLDALIAACRDGRGGRERVDAALSALCREAASGDEDAGVLLLWLLLPGLLLARARLARIGVLSVEDLTSEMCAGVWNAASRLSVPARRVASRLVNSARWRALGAVREAIDWAGRTRSMPAEAAEGTSGGYGSPLSEVDPATGAVREGVLSMGEAMLVLADHQALLEITEGLGISLAAARQRRRRARARLRTWLSGI